MQQMVDQLVDAGQGGLGRQVAGGREAGDAVQGAPARRAMRSGSPGTISPRSWASVMIRKKGSFERATAAASC